MLFTVLVYILPVHLISKFVVVFSRNCSLATHDLSFFQMFLGALSFVYFAKALAEGYLKSTITQIERRFDIPSSLVGVIDGSFEIGKWFRWLTLCLTPFILGMAE